MNDLEAQLRSWVPRRPSARLERRLFRPPFIPTAAPAAVAAAPPAFRLSWFAPAAAALLLVCLFFNQHNNSALSPANTGPLVAMIPSNQSATAYLSGTVSQGQNRLPAAAYEWSVRSGATSVINAVLGSQGTN